MSEHEASYRLKKDYVVSVDDIRQLKGASTPHFAQQVRARIVHLIVDLPPNHPARTEGEQEIERLDKLARDGQWRGPMEAGERPLPSLKLG